MLWRLLVLFTVVPTIELVLLLVLADNTSWQFTVGLIIITGFIGAALARHEGLRCYRRIQEQLASGRLPGDSMMDGLMILVAGALLVTPGVLTDLVGFALLFPPFRGVVRAYAKKRFAANIQMHTSPGGWPPGTEPPARDRIIDTKVIEED